MTDVFMYTRKVIELNSLNNYVNSKNNLKIGILPEEDLKFEQDENLFKHKDRNP